MQIVIEIPESEIPKQQDIIEIPLHFVDGKVCEAGGYGFDVLPKGHGRLIDADSMKTMKSIQSANFNAVELIRLWIDRQDTIIGADKAESEGEE